MSLWQDDPRPSRATLASLFAVAAVAVASLSRLFDGEGYLLWALAGVTIGSALALLFGRRSLGLGFIVLAIGWTLSLPGLFAREQSAAGFPTNESFRAAWRLLGNGIGAVAKTVPPVATEPKFLVLVWTSFLFLGFLGASWVVVRRPVGALISALGVVTFGGSLGEGPGRSAIAIAAVASSGAFFLAEGRQRIARWAGGQGRIPAWFGVPTLLLASALALGAPFLLGEAPVVKLRSAIRPRVVIIKPLSDIKRQLKVEPPIEVMRVTSQRATYWRLTGLDSYDGREWVLEARPRAVRTGDIAPPRPPTTGDTVMQHYRLTSLLSPWMPAAYAARALKVGSLGGRPVDAGLTVEVDERSQTLLLRGETTPGLAYTVTSQVPQIAANMPAAAREPTHPSERTLAQIARPIVAGAQTPLDIARRLETHFKAYNYNEDLEGGHSVERLLQFLRDRTGYCEQFAATMTLMLRGLGVDARVGVGFLPGALSGGEYLVSTREAHAWVEANIPGAGWTNFDPTPGRGDTSPTSPETEEQQEPPPAPSPETTSVPAATPEPQDFPEGVTEEAGRDIPAPLLWSFVAAAVLAAIPVAKRVRRTVRQLGEPQEVILGAFAELTDRARELGWTPSMSETQREFYGRVAGADVPSFGVDGLPRLVGRALYGPPGLDADDGRTAWAHLKPAIVAMRSRARWWRRMTAPLDPRSFIPPGILRRARRRVAGAFARA